MHQFDLLVDSRLLRSPGNSCFLALPGKQTNGRKFAQRLATQGVEVFILPGHFPEATSWLIDWPFDGEDLILLMETKLVEQSLSKNYFGHAAATLHGHQPRAKSYQAFNISLPDQSLSNEPPPNSSLRLLQALAAHHRKQIRVPILAITGTHGKTIVKDWLAQLLSYDRNIYTSPRSYNSQIGLPLSVWGIQDGLHDLAIIEAGISQRGEMERLASICQPNYGVFTVLGDAHRAGFSDVDDQLREKFKLFERCEWVVTLDPAGSPLLQSQEDYMGFIKSLDLSRLPDLPVPYLHNAYTALAAAVKLGATQEELEAQMSKLSPLSNLLQTRMAPNDCLLIDDSYSNDLTSLAAAIDFADIRTHRRRLTLFLSDLLQSGRPPEELYAEVAAILNGRVERVFLVGQEIEAILPLLSDRIEVHYFEDLSSLQRALPTYRFQEETILLKGARVFGMEELGDQLLQRRHHTRLEIDTGALLHNLSRFREVLLPETTLAVMVKASAYGSGDLAIAQLLERNGIGWFFVAYANEGIALRKGGIKGRILVLNPSVDQLSLLKEYGLEPILHNRALLKATLSPDGSKRPPDVVTPSQSLLSLPEQMHIELDSGMSRLGFSPEDLPWVIEQLKQHEIVEIGSLMSHLAAAEDPEEDHFSQVQADRLQRAAADLRKSEIGIGKLHLLNSSGISRHRHHQLDLVRLGIGLYGVGQHKEMNLRPVLSLVAPITAIRSIGPDQTVSYSRKGRLKKEGRIGVVGMGYADGLPRLAGNGRFCFKYQDYLLSTLGNICMDMCMVDLSEVDQDIGIGSELVVFGHQHPIELLAEAAMTIPYEILTGIGSRVQRIYIGE
ncbi:MAG: alanine racemase [Bacteroidota bacterium]